MLENVLVGARGWACSDYYPEDLPETWQVDYYANDFSALLVPQSQWAAWDKADWVAFAESADTLQWVGFEWREGPGMVGTALQAGLAQLAEALPAQLGVLAIEPLPCALSPSVAVTHVGAQDTAGWHWRDLSGAPLGFVETLPQDLKAQRALLEDFAASLPGKNAGAPFIVGQGCANIPQLKHFKQLVELLGL